MKIVVVADEVHVSSNRGICDGCGCGVGKYQHTVLDCLKFFNETVRHLIRVQSGEGEQ